MPFHIPYYFLYWNLHSVSNHCWVLTKKQLKKREKCHIFVPLYMYHSDPYNGTCRWNGNKQLRSLLECCIRKWKGYWNKLFRRLISEMNKLFEQIIRINYSNKLFCTSITSVRTFRKTSSLVIKNKQLTSDAAICDAWWKRSFEGLHSDGGNHVTQ